MSGVGSRRGRCGKCGRAMRSTGAFVCSRCLGKLVPEALQLEEEAYCEWCGTRHGHRQSCRDRAERSAVDVRLWMAGLSGLREEPDDD